MIRRRAQYSILTPRHTNFHDAAAAAPLGHVEATEHAGGRQMGRAHAGGSGGARPGPGGAAHGPRERVSALVRVHVSCRRPCGLCEALSASRAWAERAVLTRMEVARPRIATLLWYGIVRGGRARERARMRLASAHNALAAPLSEVAANRTPGWGRTLRACPLRAYLASPCMEPPHEHAGPLPPCT